MNENTINRTDVDALSELPVKELESRLADAVVRVETRAGLAYEAGRKVLTTVEADDMARDKAEMEAIRDAVAIAEHRERQHSERVAAIGNAIEGRSQQRRLETTEGLSRFAAEVAAGRPVRLAVEHRDFDSATAGARGAVALETLGRPQWLYTVCGIPFAPADSLTISGPLYAALVAQSATPESVGGSGGEGKPYMADPTLAEATLEPFAVLQVISDAVIRFGVGATAVTNRLAAEVVFSVNAAIAAALETAAGEAIAGGATGADSANGAIAKLWAQTGSKPTALLVNSADYPALADKAVAGPGDTVGAEIVRFNGVVLAVNDEITAGVGVAVNGAGFSSHGTPVEFASLPDLDYNTVKLRAESYFALLQHDAGAVVAVDLGTGS